jgi:hypothetical protein
MARPETLIPGNCYFSVGFYDNDLLLSMIDTLVYVGQETDQDERRLWLFKEPDSPPSPEEQDPSSEPPALIGFSDKQLHEIVDFDGLMHRLREIAVDHPLKPIPEPAIDSATDEDFESLPGEVAKFLNDPECVSLTMTIRFTDDGLSLGRREGGYEMGFFRHPRRDPDEAGKLLSLFASIGVQPHVDYLADGGRTRVLEFSIPSEHESIVDLCRRARAEVYSMRRGDVLDYHPLKRADIPPRRESGADAGPIKPHGEPHPTG